MQENKSFIVGSKDGLLAIFLIVVAVVVILVMGVKEKSTKKTPPKLQETAVNVWTTSGTEISPRILVQGRVVSQEVIQLFAERGGRVLGRGFQLRLGERFKQGEVLYSLESGIEKASWKIEVVKLLEVLGRALPEIKLDFPQEYAKWKDFFENVSFNRVPKLPSLGAKEKLWMSQKGILAHYFSAKVKELDLKKKMFFAPFSGVVSKSHINAGGILRAGGQVAEIINTNKLELEFHLPSGFVGNPVRILDQAGMVVSKSLRITPYMDKNTGRRKGWASLPRGYTIGEVTKFYLEGDVYLNSVRIPKMFLGLDQEVFIVNRGKLDTLPKTNFMIEKDSLLIAVSANTNIVWQSLQNPILGQKIKMQKVNP